MSNKESWQVQDFLFSPHMAFPFTVTVNFDILADCHIEAATKPGELEAIGIDATNSVQEIQIDHIATEERYEKLRSSLKSELEKHQLQEHEDHLIYLFYLLIEFSYSDFQYNEHVSKHASSMVKKLIDLVKLNEADNSKDLSITIRNKKSKSVAFQKPLLNEMIWNKVFSALVEESISSNPLLVTHLKGQEITLELLYDVSRKLKVRTGANWNKTVADFADMLLHYLSKQNLYNTSSKPSTTQAQIIYGLLKVFGLIGPNQVSSDGEDYVRTLLKNHKLL